MMRAGRDYGEGYFVEVVNAYENKLVGQVFAPSANLGDQLCRSNRTRRITAEEYKAGLRRMQRWGQPETAPIGDEQHEHTPGRVHDELIVKAAAKASRSARRRSNP